MSSESKAGKDAAELAGLDNPTGIIATNDLDAILNDKPECAVYTAMADNRLPDELVKPIEEATTTGQSSVFVNGIDPGFANDLLPLALAGTCQSIEQIRCMEIINYDTYDGATVMFDVMGFGKPLDEIPMLLQPGVLSLAWGSVIRQLAAGLGISLDGVTETYVCEPAPEDFDLASGHIPKGSAAALRFEVRGMLDGRPAAVLEHVTRLRDDLCPIGRNPPSLAARTGSRSPANPPTRWTSASAAEGATTTTPAWSPRRRASSTPSPRWWRHRPASGRRWTCR